jgi:serine/threonine protein kinase
MHSIGVTHLDIKPENILLINKTYKICDFGSVVTSPKVYSQLSAE